MGKLVTEPNKIIIVDLDKWIGMYLNGKMEYQSHKLGLKNFVNYCVLNDVDIKNVIFYEFREDGKQWFNTIELLPKFFTMINPEFLIRKI